ncbi:MAG TPA: pilin [Candidatus Paceibacterota bacterium]|nr:pilin [Candidatus Paceibacterota bacterium]
MKKFSYMAALSAALPFSAAAAPITDIWSIFRFVQSLLNTILPLIIAAAVVWFVWSMFQLFLAGDAEEKKEKAKTNIIYGVVAIFVMVSIWGLVNILVNTFGLSNQSPTTNGTNQLPNIPING